MLVRVLSSFFSPFFSGSLVLVLLLGNRIQQWYLADGTSGLAPHICFNHRRRSYCVKVL